MGEEAERQRLLRQKMTQPRTAIVRGPDGYLYRVILDDDTSSDEESMHEQPRHQMPVNEQPTRREETPPQPMETESIHSASTSSTIYHDAIDDENTTVRISNKTAGDNKMQKKKSRKNSKKGRKKNRKKITITVEDASDSEDDDFSSPWRNRRPGPGESWIEPVEQ